MAAGARQAAVLGIDAAWTDGQPSGVALFVLEGAAWSCRAVAPSYAQFEQLARGIPVNWSDRPPAGAPEVDGLMRAARALADPAEVRVVAVDMPLSRVPITGRRPADTAVSRAFGGRGCAVHSPMAERPGRISDEYRSRCERLGFRLATRSARSVVGPSLIEVYPHAALLDLLGLDYRFPYKVSRRRKYWKGLPVDEQKSHLARSFSSILSGLEPYVTGVTLPLPSARAISTFSELKRYEDGIDALVCAWVGAMFFEGRCRAYGGDDDAVWVPVTNAGDSGTVG